MFRAETSRRSSAGSRFTPRWRWAAATLAALGVAVLLCSAFATAQGQGKARPPRPASSRSVDPRAAAATGSSGDPADFESAHFLVHTDLNPKDAKALLARLETMLALISKYWGRPPAGVIEMYVVEDLSVWPAGKLDPLGRAKIEAGAGVTLTQTLSLGGAKVAAKSIVYAVAQPGVAQHEAVHAYCGQSFGATGPLWYSEGMAEMGNYWRQDDSAVRILPGVLNYLQMGEPQTLDDIVNVNNDRNLGNDTWQNYAWRWALCHLLANNPNYAARFRPLGLGFLTEQHVSFADTYGAMAKEIEFEYLFFTRHIDDGFRVDLCAWDWKKKSKPLLDEMARVRVDAHRGWQASGLSLRAGKSYDYSASGSWQIVKDGENLSADGDSTGAGRLEAALFRNYKLSEPISLGAYGSFTPPGDGELFLRCHDGWGAIADNKGIANVRLRVTRASDPLPRPATKDASPKDASPKERKEKKSSPKPAAATASLLPATTTQARRPPQ